jgi:hypothetical protein
MAGWLPQIPHIQQPRHGDRPGKEPHRRYVLEGEQRAARRRRAESGQGRARRGRRGHGHHTDRPDFSVRKEEGPTKGAPIPAHAFCIHTAIPTAHVCSAKQRTASWSPVASQVAEHPSRYAKRTRWEGRAYEVPVRGKNREGEGERLG